MAQFPGLIGHALIVGMALVSCRQSETRGTFDEPASRKPAAGDAITGDATPGGSTSGNAAQPGSAAPRTASLVPPAQPRGGTDEWLSQGYREISWQLQGPFGLQPVVVAVPKSASEQHRLPVLVVFHGRGESLKSPARGARGFIDDYGLLQALQRLEAPPLSQSDFGPSKNHGAIATERLQAINDSFADRPYQGLIVVCPYLPDILRAENFSLEGRQLARFVVSTVLPKVYAETPALPGPAHTAVDGISLGGRAAWAVAVFEPQAFSVAAATQPALDQREISMLASLTAQARQKNPKLQLRLLSSDRDYFLEPTRLLSEALRAIRVEHRLDQVMGDHGYAFNRGPGVYEMLFFAERTLSGSKR